MGSLFRRRSGGEAAETESNIPAVVSSEQASALGETATAPLLSWTRGVQVPNVLWASTFNPFIAMTVYSETSYQTVQQQRLPEPAANASAPLEPGERHE